MKNPELQVAKEIVVESVQSSDRSALLDVWPGQALGPLIGLWNFTKMLQEAEVETIVEIDNLMRNSVDLAHLCGLHKRAFKAKGIVPGFRHDALAKAGEIRTFWGFLWTQEKVLKSEQGLGDYIQSVFENSTYRAGRSRRSFGLFLNENRRPWQTPEWYEQRKPKRELFSPCVEFYPYLTAQPTEEHDLIMTVDSLVPKNLPNQTRADVCQDMIVAVLSGEVTVGNLKDATSKYVKQFFKMFPPKYGHLSLDHPFRPGDSRTLGEMLADKNTL